MVAGPGGGASQLARYRDPTTAYEGMPLVPPFYFAGVTARVFPLRASVRALQQFCDTFLNVMPEELGRFRPSLPYVYLMMLDYGRMASRAANMGRLSQHEVMFSVPLEWYRVVCGRWVFKDWAWTSPFIYVDREVSMTLGRTVYGWPKVLVSSADDSMEWMRNPTSPVRVASISAPVFGRAYQGMAEEELVFLDVRREASRSFFRLPPDFRSPLSPWMAAPNAVDGLSSLARDLAHLARHNGAVPPHTADRIANLGRMGRVVGRATAPVAPDLHFNTVNLKQFRDVSSPENYCYQAVTNTRMDVTAFNRGGPLGELSLFALDPRGGYSVHLHRWPSLPIIETLGIEVAEQWRDGDVDVARLDPVMPFWYDVDMGYNLGETLGWRTCDTVWRGPLGATHDPVGRVGSASERRFNSLLGATAQTIPGPFRFLPSTVRVLPLLASARALQERYLDPFLNGALSSPGGRFRLRLWGGDPDTDEAFVYLTVSSTEKKASETNAIGTWREYEMSFLVPVRVEEKTPSGWVCRSFGAVPAFTFVNTTTAAISATEVVGIQTTRMRFERPDDKWMDDRGPSDAVRQGLLRVHGEVLTVLGEGQQTEERLIVEVAASERDLPAIQLFDDEVRSDAVRLTWEALRDRLDTGGWWRRDDGALPRALAAKMIAGAESISIYTLKQFRDVKDPDRACYQALTRVRRCLEPGMMLERIADGLHVRIHTFPTVPIVERLGLVCKDTFLASGGLVHTLEAIKPFWLRSGMVERLGETLCERGGDEPWSDPCARGELEFLFSGDPDGLLDVGAGLDDDILRAAPKFIAAIYKSWLRGGGAGCTRREAKEALEATDPFTVVQSVLDGEWEDHSGDTRWESASGDIDAWLRGNFDGVASIDLPTVAANVLTSRATDLRPVNPLQARSATLLREDLQSLGRYAAGLKGVEEGWRRLHDPGAAGPVAPSPEVPEVPTSDSAPPSAQWGANRFVEGIKILFGPQRTAWPARRKQPIDALRGALDRAGMPKDAAYQGKWLIENVATLSRVMPSFLKGLHVEADASVSDAAMLLAKFSALEPGATVAGATVAAAPVAAAPPAPAGPKPSTRGDPGAPPSGGAAP